MEKYTIDSEARRQAKRYRDQYPDGYEEQLAILFDEYSETAKVTQALHEIKPLFYSRLAGVMDDILTAAHTEYEESGGLGDIEVVYGLLGKGVLVDISWERFLECFVKLELTSPTDPDNVAELEKMTAAISQHHIQVPDNLERLLYNGVHTAVNSTLLLAREMNKMLLEEELDDEEREAILRKSTSPMIRSANLSVVDIGYVGRKINRWKEDDKQIFISRGDRLDFAADFYDFLKSNDVTIPEFEKPVIGCPILLNQGQIQLVWEWGVEMMGKAGKL